MPSNNHNYRRPVLSDLGGWGHCTSFLVTLMVTLCFGAVHAQGVVRGQGTPTPGARMATPAAGVSDRRSPTNALSYVGIMGAVNNPGVYSSPDVSMALSDLVERAGGLTDGASRMAHVIRDGRAGLRVFFTSRTSEPLFPGDVVVFQGGEGGQSRLSSNSRRAVVFGRSRTGETAPTPDIVHVAFVGLLARQPIIVKLDGRYATVPNVVHDLRQSPAVVETVRVIPTDRGSRPVRAGVLPKRLVDGDVLVFDREAMKTDALARTQTTAQTQFPPAIPMNLGPLADSTLDSEALDGEALDGEALDGEVVAAARATGSPTRVTNDPQTSRADHDAINSQTASEAARLAAEPARDVTNHVAFDENKPTDGVRSQNSNSIGLPNNPAREWLSFSSTSPDGFPVAGDAAKPGVSTADIAGPARVPFLDITPLVQSTNLASLLEPNDFDIDELLAKAASTHIEPAPKSPLPLPLTSSVPTPMDPLPTSAESEGRGPLAALDTPTIVIGVLALAAMCFAVSIAWTRIDRTAQTLEQPIHARSDDAQTAPSRRQVLERLINNDLPMIEESAQLPNRMDYHGEELGRRRLMLDEPHELMGPHFMADTEMVERELVAMQNSATQPAPSPPERVRAEPSGFTISGGEASTDSSQQDARVTRVTRVDDSPSHQQTSGSEGMGDSEPSDTETRQPAELQPHSRLLERVLIAMERERRL